MKDAIEECEHAKKLDELYASPAYQDTKSKIRKMGLDHIREQSRQRLLKFKEEK